MQILSVSLSPSPISEEKEEEEEDEGNDGEADLVMMNRTRNCEPHKATLGPIYYPGLDDLNLHKFNDVARSYRCDPM